MTGSQEIRREHCRKVTARSLNSRFKRAVRISVSPLPRSSTTLGKLLIHSGLHLHNSVMRTQIPWSTLAPGSFPKMTGTQTNVQLNIHFQNPKHRIYNCNEPYSWCSVGRALRCADEKFAPGARANKNEARCAISMHYISRGYLASKKISRSSFLPTPFTNNPTTVLFFFFVFFNLNRKLGETHPHTVVYWNRAICRNKLLKYNIDIVRCLFLPNSLK